MSSLKCSLGLLGLLTESLDDTTLLGAPPTVQLMFVSSTYRITGLHYTYGSATLSAAYVGYLYVENHRVTLQLLVRHLKQNLCWLPLTFRFTGFLFNLEVSSVKCSLLLLVYLKNHWITLHFWVPHLKFSPTYRINKLHNTNGNVTLRADCVGYLCFQNDWVTPHIWVSNLKRSLCLLALLTESLGYTTSMGD